MTEILTGNINQHFEYLLETGNEEATRQFLDHQNISDVADLINEFPDKEAYIITHMSINRASSVFKILDLSVQKDIIQELPPFKTAELLNDLSPDDRTDFLEELPSNVVRELIKLLEPEERKTTLSLLGYPEDSIGRLMTPDYVYVFPENTIEEVFTTIRKFGQLERAALDRLLHRGPPRDPNAAFEEQLTFGQRVADGVARFGGSWKFIGAFFLFMLVWMIFNTKLHKPFDALRGKRT